MTSRELPLVSIVTPAYNQAEYLVKTIESVLAQDYKNIEYIVLNDGSTDCTEEVLRRYDGRLRWETQANMGQSKTLNKGWELSNGKYVGYLSSDDILYPQAVSELVKALENSLEVGVVYCDFDIINGQGRYVKQLTSEEYVKDRLVLDLICQPGVGALFRKDLLVEVGGWSSKLRQVPDLDFWLRMAKCAPFKRVDKVLGAYRVYEGSASFGKITVERANEIIRVMDLYWSDESSDKSVKSKAKARVFAAKNHAQSLRPMHAFVCFFKALLLCPCFVFDLSVWRMVFSGFFRGIYYKFF